jgi:hypothetical protein
MFFLFFFSVQKLRAGRVLWPILYYKKKSWKCEIIKKCAK